MTKHLIVDCQNLAHRYRAGFDKGDHAYVYKFMRGFRALVAEHAPDHVTLVKEGHPRARHEIFPDYKANRQLKQDDPEIERKMQELMKFHEDVKTAVEVCLKGIAVDVIKHHEHECDDVAAELARKISEEYPDHEVVVATNDRDFDQLVYEDLPNVKVWDLGKKTYYEKPTVDPVVLKSLVGDKGDNIPGVPGFGPKKAEKLASDAEALAAWLSSDDPGVDDYRRNLKLVRFARLEQKDWDRLERQKGRRDPGALIIDFANRDFKSLLELSAWTKFDATFADIRIDPVFAKLSNRLA